MKKLALILVTLMPFLGWAERSKSPPKTDPAEYTVQVHVQSSKLVDVCRGGECSWVQHLFVVIDGKKYELSENATRTDLMRIGDYQAKILDNETERPYEYQRIYEIRLPDGWTRKYFVVGESE
jgi:hypothetical protein